MSGKKISEMTAITGAQLDQTNDVLPVLDVSDTTNPNKKISIQELASVLSASGTTNVDLSLDSSNNLTLTDSDNNTVTVDLSSLDNSSLTLADVTANGAVTNQDITLSSDGFLQLPNGTTAERPVTPANGMIRYNSDDDVFEGYDGDWRPVVTLSDYSTGTNNALKVSPAAGFVDNGSTLDLRNVDGTLANIRLRPSGSVQIQTRATIGAISAPAVTLDIQGTDAVQLTSGTTAERPTGAAGMIRFNTTTSKFEGYDGTAWIDLN